jgi:tellurite resistance protein
MKSKNCKLKNFPISFFAIPLGLSGLALAWQKIEPLIFTNLSNYKISIFLFGLSSVVFGIILFFYIIKSLFFTSEVIKEFTDPIKINFFPILAKIMLIFSIILLGYELINYSKIFWIIGTLLQLGLSLWIMSYWMHKDKFQIKHINPAIFMPIVGNLMIPIAGIAHANIEISWFFFSVGIVLWIIFTTIVINRIIFHDPLPEKLVPTFFILMAPPAIGFIAYGKLTGGMDIFSKVIYYFSFFMFLLLIFQAKEFIKIKFYLSSWAYSFPLAAFTIASFFMYHLSENLFFKYLSFLSLLILNLIIILLFAITIKAIRNREICIEEK